MDFLSDPNIWIAFAMLTALEIVLGIDNIIFISILVGRLPAQQRDLARRLGLGFAMATRLLLLFTLTWVMGLTADLFNVFDKQTGYHIQADERSAGFGQPLSFFRPRRFQLAVKLEF